MASFLRPLTKYSSALSHLSVVRHSPAEICSLSFRVITSRRCVDNGRLNSLRRNCHSGITSTTRAGSDRRTIVFERSNLVRRKLLVDPYHPIQRRCYSEFRNRPDDSLASIWARLDPSIRLAVIGITIGLIIAAAHLERVPQTGRWRLMFFSEEMEARLQDDQYKELLEEYSGRILPAYHPVNQQVQSVVSAILDANGLGILASSSPGSVGLKSTQNQIIDVEIWNPDVYRTDADVAADRQTSSNGKVRKWNLMVVQDDSVVNAMVVNGNIVVFTGILPIANDIDGLAAVLSHEIAHVVARHLAEKLSSQTLLQVFFYALEFLGIDVGLGPMVVKFLYQLPNSRTMELEADKIGLELASKACFDPRGAVSMQTRLAQLEARHVRGINLSFLQTHPSGVVRVKRLTDALPEAYALRAGSSACAHLEDDFDAFRTMADSVRNEQEHEMV